VAKKKTAKRSAGGAGIGTSKVAEELKRVREKTVGELIDGTLETVRQHPGPSVICAAVVGFFLGKLFR